MNISISISIEEVEALARLFTRAPLPPTQQEQPAPESPKQKRVIIKEPVTAEVLTTSLTLARGDTAWRVEIDGVPTKWMLDYNQAHLPMARGSLIVYQGKQYRITHIYGTAMKLTSIDGETYDLSRDDHQTAVPS